MFLNNISSVQVVHFKICIEFNGAGHARRIVHSYDDVIPIFSLLDGCDHNIFNINAKKRDCFRQVEISGDMRGSDPAKGGVE